MSRLILPEERPRRRAGYVWACLGLTLIPALILAFRSRPFTQEHIGLLLAALSAGACIYWTASNLLTGVFISSQGNYKRRDAPIRYWLNTGLVAMGTALAIAYLVHQAAVVAVPDRPLAPQAAEEP